MAILVRSDDVRSGTNTNACHGEYGRTGVNGLKSFNSTYNIAVGVKFYQLKAWQELVKSGYPPYMPQVARLNFSNFQIFQKSYFLGRRHRMYSRPIYSS